MDIGVSLKLIVIIVTGVIYIILKGDRELTQEKIDLNNKLIAKQRDNTTLILYLRDFSVDGLRTATVKVGDFKSTFTDTNFETELSITAGQIGHFIAVGISSKTGDIGADRYTIEDEQWKDRITELMEKCSMILIRPSLSVGLIWELEQLVKNDYLRKAVICYHRRQDGWNNYKLFRDVTEHLIKFPKFLFASKFMCIDENKNVTRYSLLEETPIFRELLTGKKVEPSKRFSTRELIVFIILLLGFLVAIYYI